MKTAPLEIECPLCDKKVNADSSACPHCGAELKSHEIGELEALAGEIISGEVTSSEVVQSNLSTAKGTSPGAVASVEPDTVSSIPKKEEMTITDSTIGKPVRREKKGFFGIFGGKKR
ncbi:MAG: hypothetical protein QHH00_07455 [Methanomassiliicoccales archaeon]|jgi:hypothetical protein|nr:hypothetical protein [Methanomassiliicoccales archaeon]